MGIRETLKSLRGGDKNKAEEDITEQEAPEPTWFQPRFDGSYVAGIDSGDHGDEIALRFLPRGKVVESPVTNGTAVPDERNPCQGEYTAAGRFNVQRQFERIISYAVLEMEPEGSSPGASTERTGVPPSYISSSGQTPRVLRPDRHHTSATTASPV